MTGNSAQVLIFTSITQKNNHMKKTVLICGLIAGLISTSLFIGLMLLGKAGDDQFKHGMIYGYTLMILAFSFIFVGTKITRDKYNGGGISFGKAFRVGLYITLIASTIYVIVWLIDYYVFIPDFADKYGAHVLESMRASGATQAEIARQGAANSKFSEMYKNPLFNALITYSEIVPVGLIVSLISAWTLRRKIISLM
jgi:predicted permease